MRDVSMKRALAAFVAFAVILFAAAVLAAPAGSGEKSQDTHIGIKAGYNTPNMIVDMIYEEHTRLSTWHLAAYGGYDFGSYKITGTLWNYFLKAPDGIWRASGDNPIDQTYIEMAPGGVIGPTVDISFDIPLHQRVLFNPGLGLGIGFRYGKVTQYDYESKPGSGWKDEADLKQDDIRPEEKSNGKTFATVLPLIHLDADWTFIIDRNWFAMVNLGFQTFGFNVGAGVGYQF